LAAAKTAHQQSRKLIFAYDIDLALDESFLHFLGRVDLKEDET